MTQSDYQLEWIHTLLSAGRPEGVTQWRDTFDQAREGWQLERAQRLL